MAGAKSQTLLQMGDPNQRGSTPWEQAAVILFCFRVMHPI